MFQPNPIPQLPETEYTLRRPSETACLGVINSLLPEPGVHRQDSSTSAEQLDGLEPVVEDWHTKMCMFEVHKYIVMDMYICLTSW